MSEETEEKGLTAQQLFNSYMRAIGKVRGLSKSLLEKTMEAENLATQLAAQFGIYVSGAKPTAKRQRPPDPAPDDGDNENEGGEFKPPVQMHADAPQIATKGSEEVADIRRDAGLDVEAADSEALAAEGLEAMAELQARMKGKPTAMAIPGEHQGGTPSPRGNAEGGPVRQGPKE